MSKVSLRRLSGSFLKGFACVAVVSFFAGVLYSDTPSWPYSYFFHVKRMTPDKGDLTVFWHEGRQRKIIKKVIGKSGDKIFYDDEGSLWVNETKIGKVHTRDSLGKPLHPIPPQSIPQGLVFVYSPHERSFDSRYQEVGLVPVEALQGKVIPLR